MRVFSKHNVERDEREKKKKKGERCPRSAGGTAGSPPCNPVRSLRHRATGGSSSARASTPRSSARSSAAAEQVGTDPSTSRAARGSAPPSPRGRGEHRRQQCGFVAAGDQSRGVAREVGRWSTSHSDAGSSRCPRAGSAPRPRPSSAGRPTAVVPRALRAHVAVRGRRAHRRQVGHHPRRHRRVRSGIASTRAARLGRRPLRTRSRANRCARSRRSREADRHHASRRARRRPARDVARSTREAQARRPRERRAHGRFVVPDHRRCRGGARHHCRAALGSSA